MGEVLEEIKSMCKKGDRMCFEEIIKMKISELEKNYIIIGLPEEKIVSMQSGHNWQKELLDFLRYSSVYDIKKAINVNEIKNDAKEIEEYYSIVPERASLLKKTNPRIYDFVTYVPIDMLKKLEEQVSNETWEVDKNLDELEKKKGIQNIYRLKEVDLENKSLSRSSVSKKKINYLLKLIFKTQPEIYAIHLVDRRREKNSYKDIEKVFHISRSSLSVLRKSKHAYNNKLYKIIVYSPMVLYIARRRIVGIK